MKFTISHARAVTGNTIEVGIGCDSDEEIVHVKVELDGFPLADEDIEPAAEEYDNEFANAGDAGPLMEHKLVVTVTTSDVKSHSSTTEWADPI